MRFDTSQHMKLSQQMKLAPRMIQSMEILQMPLAQLEERIEQELESNVTLEAAEPGGDEPGDERAAADEKEPDAGESDRPLNVEENGSADDFARLDSMESSYAEAFDNEYGSNDVRERPEYEPTYSPSRQDGDRDAKQDAMANTAARGKSLVEQLLEQWSFAEIDDELRAPGRLLISHVDDDGYIRTPLETIMANAPQDAGPLTKERLERALLAVQLFLDPPGVGARDVRECLLLQADAMLEEQRSPALERVRLLIDRHYDDILHNRLPRIAEKSGLTTDQINESLEHMRRFSLWPGRTLVDQAPPAIVPDAIVEYDESRGDYFAYLSDSRLPNLQLNREYALMSRDRSVPKPDREFIKTNLSNAQWLIDAIQQRRQTLQRVINAVVAAQRDVFEYGPQATRPLPMTQVADQLGIHVATVSRAVAGKYLQTPRGIMPLRKFFTGGTTTDSGEDVSWEAIRAALQEVVDAENKNDPLSDEGIADELKKRGIEIARRTVAKYRGQLNIPPARLRRKF